MDYNFQFNVIWQNWRLFLMGIWLTIQITSIATGAGTDYRYGYGRFAVAENPRYQRCHPGLY